MKVQILLTLQIQYIFQHLEVDLFRQIVLQLNEIHMDAHHSGSSDEYICRLFLV